MTQTLRQRIYRHQCIQDVSAVSALAVGEARWLHEPALRELQILPNTQVLDL